MDIALFQKNKPSPTGEFTQRNPNISYLLTSGNKNRQSILIDANVALSSLKRQIKKDNSTLKGVIFTHTHYDHLENLRELVAEFPDMDILVHARASKILESKGYKKVIPLANKQTIALNDQKLAVLYTPGHSFDSLSIKHQEENIFFSGDTIFGRGIGCCDYFNGGNRNIFYNTLEALLKILPEETRIYPGHYSEHYDSPPPYLLSEERKTNPYLVSILNHKRGDFDRALKQFSIDFETDDHFLLDESYIDRICDLEKNTWIPELQASRETILSRLRSGHKMLALGDHKELHGMVCWRYAKFSINDNIKKFPHDFKAFSLDESAEGDKARSAFIYNLGVRATSRRGGAGSLLLQYAFENMRNNGIYDVFVDSRIPSYHGSNYGKIENISPEPVFHDAINNYFSDSIQPAQDQLDLDPNFRFYMNNGFRPWLFVDNFINDHTSGNKRIICHINLE